MMQAVRDLRRSQGDEQPRAAARCIRCVCTRTVPALEDTITLLAAKPTQPAVKFLDCPIMAISCCAPTDPWPSLAS